MRVLYVLPRPPLVRCTAAVKAIVLILTLSRAASAVPVIFTIDRAETTVTLSGVDDNHGTLVEQQPGSSVNIPRGNFYVDFNPVLPTEIEFLSGQGFIEYQTTGTYQPSALPGNFGLKSPNGLVEYTLTDFNWDFDSDPLPLVDDSVSATDVSWDALSGVEYTRHPERPVGLEIDSLTGETGLLSGGTFTLKQTGILEWTLTGTGIEFDYALSSGDPDPPNLQGILHIDGTMVARATFGVGNTDTVDSGKTSGSVLGGSSQAGGVDVQFTEVTAAGTLTGQQIDPDGVSHAADNALSAKSNFVLAGDSPQMWDINLDDGTAEGPITLTFGYDENTLGGRPESQLFMWHFNSAANDWEQLPGIIDPVANTITVTANGLSPFALGVVPEPSSLLLAAFGFAGLAPWRWRRRRPLG